MEYTKELTKIFGEILQEKELTKPRSAIFFVHHLERKYFVPNRTMINQLLLEANRLNTSFNFYKKWNEDTTKHSNAKLNNQGFLVLEKSYEPDLLGSILEDLSTFAFLSKKYPHEQKFNKNHVFALGNFMPLFNGFKNKILALGEKVDSKKEGDKFLSKDGRSFVIVPHGNDEQFKESFKKIVDEFKLIKQAMIKQNRINDAQEEKIKATNDELTLIRAEIKNFMECIANGEIQVAKSHNKWIDFFKKNGSKMISSISTGVVLIGVQKLIESF